MRTATITKSMKMNSRQLRLSSSRRIQLLSRKGVCRGTRQSVLWMYGFITNGTYSPRLNQTNAVASAVLNLQKAKMGAVYRFCCSCSKSSCEKNYCECYKAGTGCEPWCKCSNCRNPHGTREDAVMKRAFTASTTVWMWLINPHCIRVHQLYYGRETLLRCTTRPGV